MSRPQDSRFPYLPGIDAIRALAVIAVFFYHSGVGWLPGGFLGVDVFFTISGFLITSLLLREFRAHGHLDLGRFWLRRARRLLPAVGVLIAVTMVAAVILEPNRIEQLRGDAIASLAYFANWHFAFTDVSYFDQFQRPSLFTHLWSLSVEEQFYLFWPLLFAAGMTVLGRRRLLLGVLAGALASVALAWILFDPGHDASRVYYGTDTHAVGLLAGVALALVWSPTRLRRHPGGRREGPILDAVGILALGYVLLAFFRTHDYDLALWHGGYLWLAIAAAALLACLAHPATRLGGILAQPPVLWLGLRSYSFYLWHWPVLALMRPGIDVDLPRGVLIPLQLLAVLALADLSYRYVELPFRGKARFPGTNKPASERRLRLLRPALMATTLALVLLIGWSGLFATKDHPPSAAASTAESITVRASEPKAGGVDRDPSAGGPSAESPPNGARSTPDPGRGDNSPPRIIALGDSVMIGAASELEKRLGPSLSISAEEGRQADDFLKIARRLRHEGHTPEVMIVQWGNNGPLYGDEMETLQRATSEVGELFLVNDFAPVSWAGESNRAIEEAAGQWPHTTLVDWRSQAQSHQNLLWDGIHLTPGGARLYARTVAEAVRAEVGGLPDWKHPRPQGARTRKKRSEGARHPQHHVVDRGDDAVAVVQRSHRHRRSAAREVPGAGVHRFGHQRAAEVGE